jgi:hypothetical protein
MIGNDNIRVQAHLHDRECLLTGMGFDHLMSQVLEQSSRIPLQDPGPDEALTEAQLALWKASVSRTRAVHGFGYLPTKKEVESRRRLSRSARFTT